METLQPEEEGRCGRDWEPGSRWSPVWRWSRRRARATVPAPVEGRRGRPQPGGTYRTATQTLSNTSNFDPTGEYYGYAWAIFQNMLIRGLYNYNHVPGDEGNTPQPDLVTDSKVSSDGLTYSFTIRDDVMWGPPLDRTVTTERHRVRVRADQQREPRRVLRQLLLRRDQGHDLRSRRRRTRSRASTCPTTRTSRSTWRARPVTSCTGWRCRRRTRSPKEVAGCFDTGRRLRLATWSPAVPTCTTAPTSSTSRAAARRSSRSRASTPTRA